MRESVNNYKWIIFVIGTSGNDLDGFEIITVPSKFISYVPNQFCGEHKHYGLHEYYSNYQIGFINETTFKSLYVSDSNSDYILAVAIYGTN